MDEQLENKVANVESYGASTSNQEVSKPKDLSYSAPPHPRKALNHSVTAPATVRRKLFTDHKEAAYSKSMTEKWWTQSWIPKHELKLDRLSEREKQKLIVELVKIQSDGTVEVDLSKSAPVASELFEYQKIEGFHPDMDYIVTDTNKTVPKLNIAVLVVGTRGDVQPFLAMSKRLQEFGHQVRLATHANFRSFVESAGVDFYPLGGDPRILAGYMARNKGLIPSAPGEISTQRKQLKAIIESLLPACTEPDLKSGKPFRAQAIIANPPAYGHAHVAEALGVPLHMFFTMPWTPTSEFPSPLARVPQSAGYWLSYIVVDLLIWWGIRGYINDFRKKLKLAPIAYFSMYRGSISHFPIGYMWSPHVVSKPSDWGPMVDVVGYCFLNLGSKYQPPEEFVKWIGKGTSPIYIGFGSMPLEDSAKTTNIILEALRKTGQRGIIDRGWGDLGTFPNIPDDVFLLVDCPHDWLFPQCAAVVHHGGAGTTATGLRAGCPTTIVPFFGDQYFWGDRIYHRGLGPSPIPISQLTVEALSLAIEFMLQPEVKTRAMDLAKLLENEDGVANAVDAFHRHLPPDMPLSSAPPSQHEDEDDPNPLQWLFTQIALYCGCGR
ncbi:putative sterol 3-beta-glucosyltransferase [Helianthus annuus]|uniref:Sterol 3-beta-glucosyltransferase n=1 Tax=Helianthus annuus TaxID=4232 RepID=A0A9K3N2R2_HELAN|nr:sterol 3-beta-glucosyltransferase UGT80B1 [Helianthus annuus]KAF5784700.1 putative sterol 3-beta-glucosyltransferase [Helianthus annuus]KAJ0528491.1 putative sterol 3-beta-glucosyltransferase [Helianthus annuus]